MDVFLPILYIMIFFFFVLYIKELIFPPSNRKYESTWTSVETNKKKSENTNMFVNPNKKKNLEHKVSFYEKNQTYILSGVIINYLLFVFMSDQVLSSRNSINETIFLLLYSIVILGIIYVAGVVFSIMLGFTLIDNSSDETLNKLDKNFKLSDNVLISILHLLPFIYLILRFN